MNHLQIVPQVQDNQAALWDGLSWKVVDRSSVINWDVVRAYRNSLLAESDWTSLPDTNISNKQAWLDYRQTLRNIPQTFSTPQSVVWPQKP